MAVAVSLEPFRIGMTVLMLNRPDRCSSCSPSCGRLCDGNDRRRGRAVRLSARVIEFRAFHPAQSADRGWRAGTARRRRTGHEGLGTGRDDGGAGKLSTRVRQLLNGRSLWIAGVAGLGIALPSVDYLAALAVIMASDAAAATQVGALLTFNVVAFALVEIPFSPTWPRRTGRACRWPRCTTGSGRVVAARLPRCWRLSAASCSRSGSRGL